MIKFDWKEVIIFDSVNIFHFWLIKFALIKTKEIPKIKMLAKLKKTLKTIYITIFTLPLSL